MRFDSPRALACALPVALLVCLAGTPAHAQEGDTAYAFAGVSIAFAPATPAITGGGQGVSVAFHGEIPVVSQISDASVSIAFQTAAPVTSETSDASVTLAFQNAGNMFLGRGVTIGFGVVDTTAPQTLISSGPSDGSTIFTRSATFAWGGSDDGGGTLAFSYRLDDQPFSAFGGTTSHTFMDLSPGPHTFEVRARDAAGNVDATPDVRHFEVVDRSYSFSTSVGGGSFPEGAQVPLSAYIFDAGNLEVPLGPPTVGARVSIGDPTGQTALASQAMAFDGPTGRFAATFATAGRPHGQYQVTFTFVDAGGAAIGTVTDVFDLVTGLTLTVAADRAAYDRGQTVELTGLVTSDTGTALAGVPVTLMVDARGTRRTFNVVSGPQGQYQFLFGPLATEAGHYSVSARADLGGASGHATASFVIHGLLLEPAVTVLTMSANSSRSLTLHLRNIGETNRDGVVLTVADGQAADGVGAELAIAAVSLLLPGAAQNVLVTVSASATASVTSPAVITITATDQDGFTETATVRVNVEEARGAPVIDPVSAHVGMNPGTTRSLPFTLRNDGFAPLASARVSVAAAATFGWVVVQDGLLGDVAPGATRAFAIALLPPADLPLGSYAIRLDIQSSADTLSVPMTVDITSAQVADVTVQVSDDAARDLVGASVSLVSSSVFRRVTGSGTEEFNRVVQGTTGALGRVLFPQLEAGKYTLRVSAGAHAPYEAEVIVEAGGARLLEAVLTTKVAEFTFTVTQTTVPDQYDVSLVVTYSTNLVKPALMVTPSRLDLSFSPLDTLGTTGEIRITNTHATATVTNVVVDASRLDPEVRHLFMTLGVGGTPVLPLGDLGPGAVALVPYRVAHGTNPSLVSRALGAVLITGHYVYSLRGEARAGITESAVPAFFHKPDGLLMFPPISFRNDERDGIACNLPYLGTTTQIAVQNNRDIALDLLTFEGFTSATPRVRALNVRVPQSVFDQVPLSVMQSGAAYWDAPLSRNRLDGRGATAVFDLTGLQRALETACADGTLSPPSIGAVGRWSDSAIPQGFLFPVSIETITETEVVIRSPQVSPPSAGTSGPGPSGPPQSFNNHGQVKVQIDQAVSLEREAFRATLDVIAAVPLTGLSGTLAIRTADGEDASDRFVVEQVQVPASPLVGSGRSEWLVIPTVVAGGTTAAGVSYVLTATIAYAAGSSSFSFVTEPNGFIVTPLPRLQLDYYLPRVVMGTIPFDLRVEVKNVGAGTANNVVIQSAQPRIVENAGNAPVSFGIDGASPTGQDADVQPGVTTIAFGSIAPAVTKTGAWRMHATKRGFLVDFQSTLTHRTLNGRVLDPLIEQVNVHFDAAVGGTLARFGCDLGALSLAVAGLPDLRILVPGTGEYYIPHIEPRSRLGNPPSSYVIALSEGGDSRMSREFDVLADQPTDFIDLGFSNLHLDSDGGGATDCFEQQYGLNRELQSDDGLDGDEDGLTNAQEDQNHTRPDKADTDGDTFSDGVEVAVGRDPNRDDNAPALIVRRPGMKFLDGAPLPTLPTIVLTHGWSPVGAIASELWTASASESIATVVNGRANVVRYVWPDAFTSDPLLGVAPLRSQYVDAWKYHSDAAADLAKKLLDALGTHYAQPIHFIGHSLGSVVNAEAARLFLERAPTVRVVQFTALDRPDHVDKPFDDPQFRGTHGFPETHFASVFAELTPAHLNALDLRIDNYFAHPHSLSGFGDTSRGTEAVPIYNQMLDEPRSVGRELFGSGVSTTDHTGVQLWYRWTIEPDPAGQSYCTGDVFTYPSLNSTLSPCERGWYWALNGRNPDAFERLEKSGGAAFAKRPLAISGFQNVHGCSMAAGSELTCAEASDAWGLAQLDIPAGATSISFDYALNDTGEGDYVVLFLDDVPIWTMSATSSLGTSFVRSGPLSVAGLEGPRRLMIGLYGAGEKNAWVRLQNFTATIEGTSFTISAGEDRVVEATMPTGAPVELVGEASVDQSEVGSYTWAGAFGIRTSPAIQVTLPLGDNVVTFSVTTVEGIQRTASVTVSVQDTIAPVVSAPAAISLTATELAGARPATNPLLAAFVAAGTGADLVDAAPGRLPAQVGNYVIDANMLFPIGETPVTFFFRDFSGNIGTATSTVTVLPPAASQRRIAGSGYNFPETPTYRATFSVDATGPGSPIGAVQYAYTRTRMNFVSTGIAQVSVSDAIVTIQGTGTVNGAGGFTFSVTATDALPDRFGIVIRLPDGTVYYSAPLLALSGGSLALSSP